MAVAKEYLFTPDSQLTADFGKAINHSARVEIIAALLDTPVLSYKEIVSMIPLSRSTVNNHLKALKQYRLLQNEALPSGDAGFRLNKEEYNGYRHAIKRSLSWQGRLRSLSEVQEEEVG